MYKQKISITINSNYDRQKLNDIFQILLGSLLQTGQIMGGIESPYYVGDEIISYQTTLEEDSLNKIYNDKWVTLYINNLEEWSDAKLKTEVIGLHIPLYKDVCSCDYHNSYILFTTFSNESSPIDCGTCRKPVPIYKLKELNDDERRLIIDWESAYKSCDNLYMTGYVGEKWSLKQMSDPKSELSNLGMTVCNQIETATGIAVYYDLLNYRQISLSKDKLRKCPSCNSDWLLNERWLERYDFKCNNCKLVSTLTTY